MRGRLEFRSAPADFSFRRGRPVLHSRGRDEHHMFLKDNIAVIYGAGGVGGAVGREFASEGAAPRSRDRCSVPTPDHQPTRHRSDPVKAGARENHQFQRRSQ
jgi:hypothetical protein